MTFKLIYSGREERMIEKLLTSVKKILQPLHKLKKRTYFLSLIFIGVLFILLSNLYKPQLGTEDVPSFPVEEVEETAIEEVSLLTNVREMETDFETTLQAMLNQMDGLTEVEVM